jgi:hypothetical protein
VVELLDKVGTCDNLSSFMEWNLGEREGGCVQGGFAVNEGAGEDDCCSLLCFVSI